MRHLVTWIGDHISTIDGRVVQVEMTHHVETYEEALEYALNLGHGHNVSVRIWSLVEALPFHQTEHITRVEDL